MRGKAIRSADALVEEQLGKWRLAMTVRTKEKVTPGSVITLSRESGCGGTKIAQGIGKALGFDLMGGKIIQMIAESVEMSEKVVCSLDEKEMTKRDDWLTSLFETRHLWPDQYLHHLTKVIGTIGHHGNAVILGRGANFILPQENTFRVRIIAPFELRVKNATRTTADEAKRYLIKSDSDRAAFIRKYFNADAKDPAHYDMVLNMRVISIDGAIKAIITAFNSWKR